MGERASEATAHGSSCLRQTVLVYLLKA